MRRLLLVILLSLSHIALAADIRLGSEVPVGTPVLDSPPAGQSILGVATNGRDYLALWLDGRQPLPISNALQYALYVSRIDAAGRPVNPLGHKLAGFATGRLVSTGTTYILVYTDRSQHTFVQVLDGDGNPAGSVMPLTVSGQVAAAASNGRNIALLMSQPDGNSTLSLVDLNGMMIRSNPGLRADQIIVLPNGDYGVVANGVLVIANATTGESVQHPLPDLLQSPAAAVASSDGRILVAWIETTLQAPMAYVEMVDSSGNVIVPATAIATAADTNHPAVGWDGHEFLVTFEQQSADRVDELFAFRISASGRLIDNSSIDLGPRPTGVPQIANGAEGTLIAWNAAPIYSNDIYGRAAGSFDDLAAAPTTLLAESVVRQQLPRLAAGGSAYATWREGNESENITGSFVGGTPSAIAPGQAPPNLGAGAVARAGGSYLVVWREVSDAGFRILAKRVGLDGRPIDAVPIAIASGDLSSFYTNDDYAVGSDGTSFLVVWDQHPGVKGVRVSQTGNVLDAQPIEIDRNRYGFWAVTPRVAWSGSRYLVAWYDTQWMPTLVSPPIPPSGVVRVASVGANGQVLDTGDTPRIGDLNNGGEVALAASADGALLIFSTSHYNSSPQECAFAVPLRADGTPAASVRQLQCNTSLFPAPFANPDLAWDGREYVAVWTDVTANNIDALRFDASGTPIDDAPFVVNPAGTKAAQPAVAASANGATIAYVRLVDELPYGGVARLFARTLDRIGGIVRRRVSH